MNATSHGKFTLNQLPKLLKKAFIAWNADHPFRLSAVVAYYAILSLPALLVIIINSIGAIWGIDIVQGKLTEEFTVILGKEGAATIESMIRETQQGNNSVISTLIGIGTLIFGATGVFYHLQISLNTIWKISHTKNHSFWQMVTDRARSFIFILVIGFLLLVSFILTAGISILTKFIRQVFPDIVLYFAFIFDFALSFAVITVLFALLFKYLPNAKIQWRTVWLGAILTAILFVIGKFLLGLYFGQANLDSTYGAAGTLVLLLLWVSYSCLILFYGAKFTYVYAEAYGKGISAKQPNLPGKKERP